MAIVYLQTAHFYVFGHGMVTENTSDKRGLDSGTAILGTVHICSESTQRWHSERIICLDPKYVLLSVPHQPIFL